VSRTIRRTKEKRQGRSNNERTWLTTIPDEWNGNIGQHGTVHSFPTVWKVGKEFDQGYWLFHRDSSKYFGWNMVKGGKQSARAHNERELVRALTDPDHVPDLRDFVDKRRFQRYANPWDCK
jgi:hypothetical protein